MKSCGVGIHMGEWGSMRPQSHRSIFHLPNYQSRHLHVVPFGNKVRGGRQSPRRFIRKTQINRLWVNLKPSLPSQSDDGARPL